MTRALPPELGSLVRASAALAARDAERLDEALRHAAEACDPETVEEALVQSYLFLGYPLALGALGRWRRIREGRGPSPSREDPAGWSARGERVCREVYGDQYEALRENIRRLHPDMEGWMVEEGYGKVLGRPGLPLRDRELCIVALLAVLDVPTQLYSHLRGALNAGAPAAWIAEALEVTAEFIPPDQHRRATAVWDRVRARRD